MLGQLPDFPFPDLSRWRDSGMDEAAGGSANNPPLALADVFAATLPSLKFSPRVHKDYSETVLPMRDGIPKLKDFPKRFGGSGESVPES